MDRRRLRRRYYDLFARVYDRFVAWHAGDPTGPMRRALAERVAPRPQGRILDLCCGTGAVTCALAERFGSECLIVGLDFSGGMLARAAQAAHRKGLTSIRWILADASALPFGAGAFDAVTCAYALYELKGDGRRRMMREVERILSLAGRFLVMEHEIPTRPLLRLLLSLRLAIIGAEGARAFLGGEGQELGAVFPEVSKEVVPPGASRILTAVKSPGAQAGA